MTTAPNDSIAGDLSRSRRDVDARSELLFRSEAGGNFHRRPGGAAAPEERPATNSSSSPTRPASGAVISPKRNIALVEAEVARAVLPATFDGVYFCPDRPDLATDRRKPAPGMVFEAQRDHGIDLARSFFIGDKAIDIECGRNAGVRTILVKTGYGANETQAEPTGSRRFATAADIILAQAEAAQALEGPHPSLREAPTAVRSKKVDSRAARYHSMTKIVGIIPPAGVRPVFRASPFIPSPGKPLLQHVWERCRRAKTLDAVIIATDDMRIAEAAFAWGAEVSLTSARHASGTDRIAEVAAKLRGVSHIINIQGDEPLVDPKLIDQLARRMQRDPKIEMITAVHPFENPADAQSPHQVKAVLDRENHALYFSRCAIPYARDPSRADAIFSPPGHLRLSARTRSCVFVRWKPSPLEKTEALEQLRALENGVNIHVVVTKSGSPGVDTPDDARAIERQLLAPSRRPRQARSR